MTEAKQEIEIGNAMEDGTLLAGYYKCGPLYTTPTYAPLTYNFNEAAEYAQELNAQKFLGHDDWRVPEKGELNVLFQNIAAIGGFGRSADFGGSCYWSSSQVKNSDFVKNSDYHYQAWGQRVTDKGQFALYKDSYSFLRCVRG